MSTATVVPTASRRPFLTADPPTHGRDETLGKIFRMARDQVGQVNATMFCRRLIENRGPNDLLTLLDQLEPEWADHAIASVYTILIGGERRKKLGAYFTPPHLVGHLIARMVACGLDLLHHTIHDPAAGGAAFVVPMVRQVVTFRLARGDRGADILADMLDRFSGCEIDSGLALVANALLRRMLRQEFGIEVPSRFELVRIGDSLVNDHEDLADSWVGNPPYAKIGTQGENRWRAKFSDIARGQLNLYAMFLRRGLDRVRPLGLIGFIIPMSFIGSPDYALFRRRLVELSEVVSIDLIEKRSKVFLDVVQDACFVIVRRRAEVHRAAKPLRVSCSVVHATGGSGSLGTAEISVDGSPWRLPARSDQGEGGTTLAGYGYRTTVGYVVPQRSAERMHRRRAKMRFPLVWAKSVGSDGSFDFMRAKDHSQADGHLWFEAEATAPYVFREPLVVVQRTSNRKQERRIHAAAVRRSFFKKYGGLVGENHVVLVVPTVGERPAVSPEDLAALLNSRPVNERFARVCGTVTVSAHLLSELDLPPARKIVGLSAKKGRVRDGVVLTAYGEVIRRAA